MASKDLKIVLSAVDNASKEINKVGSSLDGLTSFAKKATLAVGAIAGGFGYVLKQTTDASNQLNNALIGLNSVSRAFGQDTSKAKQAAQELAKDGLMSVNEAATGLKNLLASRFSLPEAITLMNAFKDSAAFGKQASLGFGQAIMGATEGIKNQNSILVDNAGITKNLSVILGEAGYSAQDLGKVTTDLGVRTALYNGILKEASIFQGDAARLSDTLSGKQAALATQVFNLKAAIGEQLTPVMSFFVSKAGEVVAATGRLVAIVSEAGGIFTFFRGKITEVLTYIEQKTGVITIMKTAFDNVVLTFRMNLLPVLQELFAKLQPLMPAFEFLAKIVGLTLYGAFIAVTKILEVSLIAAMTYLGNVIKGANIVLGVWNDYWSTTIETFKSAFVWIGKLIDRIKQLNIVQGAKNMVGGALGFGGGKAIGGPVSGGTTYLVGEKGPELFRPNVSGSIVPNHKLGGGGGINITITGNTLLDNRAAEKIGDMIIQRLGYAAAV